MEILITGSNGQLGTELRHIFDQKNVKYTATDAADLDITNAEQVSTFFQVNRPKVVLHCAAYTAVDNAEEGHGKELNELVNAVGTQNVANAAEAVNALLVYVSTDYIFDGTSRDEYLENSKPNPKNEYGRAKLEGEKIVSSTMSNYYTVRTSWVYGQYGKNFVYTMLNLAKTHSDISVVNDQFGRPTWTKTLAEFIVFLLQEKPAFGTYQLSNEGSCNWYEFASEILKDKDVNVHPVSSEEYPQKAYRPRHSIMSLKKAESLGFKIPTWSQALQEFLLIAESK